ncbi:MAG: winged helix-turn-helix domain-containing protein [Pyrinomonadaceae bacterium]
MPLEIKRFYDFGDFRLDMRDRLILRDESVVALTPKAFDLLAVLVTNRGRLLGKDELMKLVWPEAFVEEANLSHHVSSLRKALREDKNQKYIQTIARRGYRFIADVRESSEDAEVPVLERSRAPVAIAEELDSDAATDIAIQPSIAPNVRTEHHAPQASLLSKAKNRWLKPGRQSVVLGGAALLVVFLGAVLWFFKYAGDTSDTAPFEKVKFTRLTAGGLLGGARITGGVSISPDGKYVVLWTEDGGRHSLWIRQVATGALQRIFGPAEGNVGGTTFSPEGEFVYFSARDHAGGANILYRVPALGGAPRKILAGVDSPITFSPDGKRFSFVRADESQGRTSLIIADLDDGTERLFAMRQIPDGFATSGPAWSPDGKVIACGGWTLAGENYATVFAAPTEGGPVTPLTPERWTDIFRVAWLADGSGLIVAAADQGFGVDSQIWRVAYPSGEARRITNDLNGYGQISLGVGGESEDSQIIITVQEDSSSQIWLAPLPLLREGGSAGTEAPREISRGKYDGLYGFAWTPQGQIVYLTQADNVDIWKMNNDGSGAVQLTDDAHFEYFPSVSPDGRYILFSSNRAGSWNIWRMDVDGQNAKQLTAGSFADNAPVCSPDGRWVVFNSFRAGRQTIWKVPIDGGEPQQITDEHASLPSISPDGKRIAFSGELGGGRKLRIISFDGGRPAQTFDLPTGFASRSGLAWTPDGKAVFYVNNLSGVGNIWSQPIQGGGPKQLTNFPSKPISRFAVSPDGKQVAISYLNVTDDLVLIREVK